MAFLEWTEQYATVPEMDEHHQHLFLLLNGLYESISTCQNLEEERCLTGDLLARLADYTSRHFSAEEILMQQASFPGLSEHQAEHAWFASQVKKLSDTYANGGVAMSFDAFSLLRNWIANHVLTKDVEYIPYLRK